MTPAFASRPRRRARGTLVVVTGLLFLSGIIRLGTGMGEALTAERLPEPAHVEAMAPPPVDLEALLQALRQREELVESRETALADRLQALDVAEERAAGMIAALVESEERLAATLAVADAAAERDVARLTAVYETMKPSDAAALFQQMDAHFAAGFLARMAPENAAAVMAGLPPQNAYTISVILAGRHVGVPKE